jgi:cell cycle checkpoint protein
VLYLLCPGNVILQKELFSNFTFNRPGRSSSHQDDSDDDDTPLFRISLESLLGTLQIFGVTDSNDRWAGRDPSYGGVTSSMYRGGPSAAFESRTLGMSGLCKFGYYAEGAPFSITLEEPGVTTTCELTTYEPDPFTIIPIQKDAIQTKIIMRASLLHDAIEELSATSPTRLSITASDTAPYFVLSASGAHGAASVEFNKDPQLLETFQVLQRWFNVYKFAYIKSATRAMAMASKVSIRGDEQGVLSLQFMVEMEDNLVSFVDFRFVPLLVEEGEEEDEMEEANGSTDAF